MDLKNFRFQFVWNGDSYDMCNIIQRVISNKRKRLLFLCLTAFKSDITQTSNTTYGMNP